MSSAPLTTACHDWHVAHGGRMVDFAGWSMPVQYTSITEEHHAVRKSAGLFDIAHMGRLIFTGPDAERFLDFLLTNNVPALQVGQIRYSLVTNERGGILDDVLVYRFEGFHLLVVNASNRLKILDWIEQHRRGFDVEVEDVTPTRCMLALQGPRAIEVLQPLCEVDLSAVKYYTALEAAVDGRAAIVSRTGYTGEDGFEVIVAAGEGQLLWEKLIAAGVTPCGLGCRDTLRLEAAMPLYGHELNETIDPLTAGLSFAVKLNAGDFIGKEALAKIKEAGPTKARIGLELEGRRIAREGATLFAEANEIGEVTSGTFSPTLEKSIAMGYVDVACKEPGTVLEVDIRGKRAQAAVVGLPFYKRG
jgi:aminomethyltransferase